MRGISLFLLHGLIVPSIGFWRSGSEFEVHGGKPSKPNVFTLEAREVSCTLRCCTPNKRCTNYFNQRLIMLIASLVSHMFWKQIFSHEWKVLPVWFHPWNSEPVGPKPPMSGTSAVSKTRARLWGILRSSMASRPSARVTNHLPVKNIGITLHVDITQLELYTSVWTI